ncbi:hypothetical protein OSTOST_15987, partial [Ostertagia ostertagi]
HERWFGGVTPLRQTSSPHQNADKARLFCTLVICLALSQNGEEGDGSKEIDTVFKSLMGLYPSTSDLARELLNSDDRFLATASALLALKKKEAMVLLDWVDGDELGFEAILAVIQSMTEDRKMWEKAVDSDGSESPPAKRQRLSSNCDAEFRTMYLEKKPAPSEDDIIVKVRVPYLEGVEDHHEETFTFSKKPVISTSYRLMLPKPDRSDFAALEEMMVELKLMLNKRLLESDGLNKDTERLRDALTVFLGEEGDDINDEELYGEHLKAVQMEPDDIEVQVPDSYNRDDYAELSFLVAFWFRLLFGIVYSTRTGSSNGTDM